MSVRTTVSLDEDVMERVRLESRSRGASFRDTLNDLLRVGLLSIQPKAFKSVFEIRPFHMGQIPGINYDDIEGLIGLGEGELHR